MKTFFRILLLLIAVPLCAGQDKTVTITSGGVERTFKLYVPSAQAGLPVVLCFHGAGGASASIEAVTRFSQLADEYNFIAAYPQALQIKNVVQWNAYVDDQPGHGGVGADDAPDDVRYVLDILDYLDDNYTIDRSRVFATGLSSGGFMSYALALMAPGTFKAIAPVAANLWGSESYITQLALINKIQPLPVMHVHGTDDDVVSYIDPDDTPKDYEEYPLFLFSSSCDAHTYSKVVHIADNVDRLVFCEQPYDISLIRIRGMGHGWTNGTYPTSRAILLFFGLADMQTDVEEKQMGGGVVAVPNPAADILRVDIPNGSATVRLYNSLGLEVYRVEAEAGSVAIPCVGLANGVYVVQIQKENSVFTRRVVIAR